jgi:transcriptional regulator with XRE-family HTH domain
MEYRKALATILREQGVSQADLARRIGKSRSYVSQLMSGRVNEPSLSIAFKIADALGVTVQDFIDLMKVD